MQAIAEQCPICGSLLDGEPTCELCRLSRAPSDAVPDRRAVCRSCACPLPRRTCVCDVCGAENPTSLAGVAPVAQLALGFTILAAVLLALNLVFGPIGA
jgi:hypothetical protein